MLVKECRMPDITDLKPSAMGCYIAGSIIGASQSRTRKEDNLLKVAARLIDKARFEYLCTREAIQEEVDEGLLSYEQIEKRGQGQFIYTPVIINHLENCINAISRIHKLLQLNTNHRGILTKIRNSIEHADERIREGTTGPLALDISEDASIIRIFFRDRDTEIEETIAIGTAELAAEITELHSRARGLLRENR